MNTTHLGLTWDHPRGYAALAAAERDVAPPGLLHWEKQPLEGFESHPIADLAARYDLLVLDHPHIGEAAASDCLRPLDELFAPEELYGWGRATIGAAMASYRWQDRPYALPLDVATQVAVSGPAHSGEPPGDWDAVVRLSESEPVALSIAGPHAVLNFFSLVLAFGAEPVPFTCPAAGALRQRLGEGDDLAPGSLGRELAAHVRRLALPAGIAPSALAEGLSAGCPTIHGPRQKDENRLQSNS